MANNSLEGLRDSYTDFLRDYVPVSTVLVAMLLINQYSHVYTCLCVIIHIYIYVIISQERFESTKSTIVQYNATTQSLITQSLIPQSPIPEQQ